MATNVTPVGINQRLAQGTITWDGEKTSDTLTVPLGRNRQVMIVIDNTGNDSQDITATLEYLMDYGNSRYAVNSVAAGTATSYVCVKSTVKAFGPIDFPLFSGGRVKVTASSAPADTKTTVITVQEV